MKILSLDLYLYKPFLHHKVKHVTLTDIPHVVVVSGENACGKSSLLRAITPKPAISSEYEKHGYKKAVYEHLGSMYILTSDFSKSSGCHSFIKDGIELNESGTADVQMELAKDYLQYTPVIDKLTTGHIMFCDASRVERREILMSTYPSSMGFILDYYKQVSSRLRAVNNNIKMLTQRKISLEQQLVSPIILSDYRKEKTDLVDAISKLDLDIYTVNKAINAGQDALSKMDPELMGLTPAYFQDKCFAISEKYKQFLQQSDAYQYDDCSAQLARVQADIDNISDLIRRYEDEAKDINKELSEYKRYLSADTETQIKECKEKIAVEENIIKNTYLEPGVPDISDYEYDRLCQLYPQMKDALSYLIQHKSPHWTEQEYIETEKMIDRYRTDLSKINYDIRQLQDELEPVNKRLEKFKTRPYPKSCTMGCVLRDDYKSLIDTVQERHDEIVSRLTELSEKHKITTTCLQVCESKYEEELPSRGILKNLKAYFDGVSFREYILSVQHVNDELLSHNTFIDAMNFDCPGVYNRLAKILEHARAAKTVKAAQDRLTLLQTKLSSLESGSGQARQLIMDSVLKKESKLDSIIELVKEAKTYLSDCNLEKKNIKIYQMLMEQLTELQSEYTAWKKIYFLKAEITYFSSFLESIKDSKNRINEKLRELDQIIKEQDNYLVRLNDEVNPELNKLKDLQVELSAVESQLSPTKGLSHVYIIRYINSVFRLANQFISRVWSYPMSLEYIDEEDESFDYSFKLLINENSSIKDINIASAGQKSIINLCVMLAICIFRHYGNDYPIILDEVTVNMSLNHQNSLITFLNELFSDEGLKQIFIVDHCIDVCSSFASIAEMVCLSRDFDIGQEWKRIGAIE